MTQSTQRLSPENCNNMAQVRDGVDAIDRDLVALLATRFAYMDAAARIKTDRSTVRDEARKSQVIGNAAQYADELGIPAPFVAEIWEQLVEASIAFELERWDEIRKNVA